jgi:hypothetical protein
MKAPSHIPRPGAGNAAYPDDAAVAWSLSPLEDLADAASAPITRRQALGALAVLLPSVAIGCTPARYMLGMYPPEFDRDPHLTRQVLGAFVETVLPGASVPGEVEPAFFDQRFPFQPYASFFAADLCRRAAALSGGHQFHWLSLDQRTAVVKQGLTGDATARKLYVGAIRIAQFACYTGIYRDGEGCPAIDFDGTFRPVPPAELTYPDPERYLAAELSPDGNFL